MQIEPTVPRSPIAEALRDVWQQWSLNSGSADLEQFLLWLERVSVSSATGVVTDVSGLDTIDSVLLAGRVEFDELSTGPNWEERLQSLWNASFASHLAAVDQQTAFLRRGAAIPQLYPDRDSRRRIYRTGLPPSTAFQLIDEFSEIETVMAEGQDYATLDRDQQFNYVVSVVIALGGIPRFNMGEREAWEPILRWWLGHDATQYPSAGQIADWHRYVGTWFSYRCCWGIGSVIGYAYERISDGQLQPMSLDVWESLGLPWVVFWLKELLSWGTQDPVAAFLLARGVRLTRGEAEQTANSYYLSSYATTRDDPLDARSIRDWVEAQFPGQASATTRIAERTFRAQVTDLEVLNRGTEFRVLPLRKKAGVAWTDIAGYVLAESYEDVATAIQAFDTTLYDFILKPDEQRVLVTWYL